MSYLVRLCYRVSVCHYSPIEMNEINFAVFTNQSELEIFGIFFLTLNTKYDLLKKKKKEEFQIRSWLRAIQSAQIWYPPPSAYITYKYMYV